MNALDVFEELRYIIELLLAEQMFVYNFAKKKRNFWQRFIGGEVCLCLIAVTYIFIRDYVNGLQSDIAMGVLATTWYISLLILSFIHIRFCFEISISDVLFIGISGYAAMHIEYVAVNEVLALGLWKNLPETLWLYVLISALTCFLWYALVIRIFAGKLKSCGGRLYEDNKETIGVFFLLLVVLLFATFSCQSIFQADYHAEDEINYMGAIMDFFICILVLVVQYSAYRINTLSREKDIVKQLLYERQKQYQLSKENIEIINHKCHDLKHQIQALREADSEDLDQYIDEVEESIMFYDSVVETHNEVLNTILSEKSLYCEKHKIKLSCIIDSDHLDFMSTMDIYALLGNALDNAIECVSKYKETEKRVISLTISARDSFLCIQTNNYYDGELQFKDGLPLSTKRNNHAYHGFGMKSMKHLTEKYGGTLYTKLENGIFMLQIVLPMPKEFLRLLQLENSRY